MTQYAFYFDSNRCTGCRACQVACKENHGLGVDMLWRRVYEYQGGSWKLNDVGSYVPDGVFGYFVSVACNHCANPACVQVCPTGAMQKDGETGIVWTDHEVCIGCRACQGACPYHAPSFDEEAGYMTKCDMCRADLDEGRTPLCVAACSMRVLDFGPREELVAKYGEGTVEVEPLPADTTGASTLMHPHRNAQASGTGTGRAVNYEAELSIQG